MRSGHARASSILLVLLAACHLPPARMAVPESLAAGGDRYDVEGHVTLFQRKVRFGPYSLKDAHPGVRRESTSGSSLFKRKESATSKQRARFTFLTPSGAAYRSTCRHETAEVVQHDRDLAYDGEHGLHISDDPRMLESRDTFRCTIARPQGGDIEVALAWDRAGWARGDGFEVAIAPSSEQVNQSFSTTGVLSGLLLREAERDVAAVDLTATTSVTLARELTGTHRDEVAAVCMALLMLRDLDRDAL